ncbi:MAG TPA: tetratricopeptide repeat protein [Chloroflexi bacterium]|nr:tetratricopeptide repeat protein [Chloroflexota bacterium]
MSNLALYLLGAPRIELDGTVVVIGRRKAVALAAYLAVTGERHSRTALARLFWPESDPPHALAALRLALLTLKEAIGEEWLEIERTSLALCRTPDYWSDVTHFRHLLIGCEAHTHSPDSVCPNCLALLTNAVLIYRDDFMAGFTLRDSSAFDDWQSFQCQDLQRRLDYALEKLSLGYGARGELHHAVPFAQRWLNRDPLNESAHRLLMRLYTWNKQREAALRQYQRCREALEQELGRFPEEETDQLYHAIIEDRLPPLDGLSSSFSFRPLLSHNLPSQSTPFLGRERELAKLLALLRDPACRLLTLVGVGGAGKTRLALQAAADVAIQDAEAFVDGIRFVSLASLTSPDLLGSAIARSLGPSFHGQVDVEAQILDYLEDRRMLLVLDNFEHLLSSPISSSRLERGAKAAGLIARILGSAPQVKMMVTSREPLDLQGEWLFEVTGLKCPPADRTEALEQYDAIRLFLQSARRVQPDFRVLEDEAPFVVRICRFLDGLPLGIELAAAWLQMFTCQEIAQRIEQGLCFLDTSLRDVPERHRSLRAVFDHSWDLLSDEEKDVCRCLSVFRGGFRGEAAAEQVAGASLPTLLSLIRKSFLHLDPDGRYAMPEVLRRYVEGKLDQHPQQKALARERHCEYYAEFLHQRHGDIEGRNQRQALEEIRKELENVRVGWEWAVKQVNMEAIDKAIGSLCHLYEMHGWFQEGEELLTRAWEALSESMQAMNDPPTRDLLILARVIDWRGWLCYLLSRFEQARDLLETSYAMFCRLDEQEARALSLKNLGNVTTSLGEYAAARKLFQKSVSISKRADDQVGIGWGFDGLGYIAEAMGEYARARRLYQRCLGIWKELGNPEGITWSLMGLGSVAEASGEQNEAKDLFDDCMAHCTKSDNQQGIGWCLDGLSRLAEGSGNYEEAKRLAGRGLAIFQEIGDRSGIAIGFRNLGFASLALGDYREARDAFQRAIDMAQDVKAIPVLVDTLVGVADLLAAEGEAEQAVELLAFLLRHPATTARYKKRAQRLHTALSSRLSPQAFRPAEARGEARTLESFTPIP